MSTAWFRRPSVLLALALCSVGGVVTLLGRLASGPRVEGKRVPLATESGAKAYPAFSPDGQRIAYSAAPAGNGADKPEGFHIFVRAVAADTPRQVTTGSGSDVSPAWSPDGNCIAFLHLEEGRAQYVVIPAAGGAEHQVVGFASERDEAQTLPAVAWTGDGKSLVIVDPSHTPAALATVPVGGGAVVRITDPPPGSEGDSTPAVSPDGATLAFVRSTSADGGDIYLCGLRGTGDALRPRRLTFDDRAIRGLAWTPNGQDVIYGAARTGSGSELWRLPAYGGSPRALVAAGGHAAYPAVARAGHRLAYVDNPGAAAIWRARLDVSGDASENRILIRSTGRESWPAYSPDGHRVAYISDQTGTEQIWVCDADGTKPEQITRYLGNLRLTQPKFAPKGDKMLFASNGPMGRGIYVLVRGKTQLMLIAPGGANGSWSRDGKTVYYDAQGRVWRIALDGGRAEAVTKELGTAQGVESADGKFVYFRHRRAVWRAPVEGGEEEEVFTPEHPFWVALQPVQRGLYYLEWAFGNRWAVSFYDFASKQNSVVFRMTVRDADAPPTYSISPDGKYIIYPRIDRNETNLMLLLENFR